ncbi:hypothetical protein AK812_SmicGene32935 [Symbiodinium microadriaticum]|uniref:Uncharacterized protein n=1 Tax=Symbiodinium microadriaticum TaxID=2951 RepID=A0A1Q9CSY0_SYMMI|nr:hypothetical protein AK812_SmicGene32935 [Symbiodinium microadriaticum]
MCVDMLLPSPALDAGTSTAQSNSRFNFRPAEDQAQSKEKDDDEEEVDEMEMIQQLLEREQSYRKELARRDRERSNAFRC